MMKIVHTKIFGLAAALFLFTACDKKSPENKPEGKNEQKQKTLQLSETFSSASDAQWVKVTEGLGTTLEVKNHPTSDNRLVYLNQSGQIGSYDTATQENNLLINLGDLVPSAGGEHGLLSVAFHPEFSNDQHPGHGKLYTYLTTPPSNGSPGVATILELSTEVNVDQIVIDRSLDRVVLEFDQPQGNHNGGTLLFGPHDGLLYLSLIHI